MSDKEDLFHEVKNLAKEVITNITTPYKKSYINGIRSGFEQLDYLTSGFKQPELIVIAGPTGVGKTSLCLGMASYMAIECGISVAIFSPETTKENLMLRMISMRSYVSYTRVRNGYLKNKEIEKIAQTASELAKANLFIDDNSRITISELCSRVRELKKLKGLDVLIIDYLQLLNGITGIRVSNVEVPEVIKSLKIISRELDILVIVVSQLHHIVELDQDKNLLFKEFLENLSKSGIDEEEPDVVIFIYRPDIYRRNPKEKNGIAEIIVARKKQIFREPIQLAFLDLCEIPAFSNLATEYDEIIQV